MKKKIRCRIFFYPAPLIPKHIGNLPTPPPPKKFRHNFCSDWLWPRTTDRPERAFFKNWKLLGLGRQIGPIVDSTCPTQHRPPLAHRLAAPQAQTEEVKVYMGGGRFDSSTIGNKQIEVTALRGVPDLFRACIASRGPPRATPIRPGGQRTRLSRGPVHQRSRSSRCSLRGRRRQQTNKGPVTKIFRGLCYIVSTTYVEEAKEEPCCNISPPTHWYYIAVHGRFFGVAENAFFVPCSVNESSTSWHTCGVSSYVRKVFKKKKTKRKTSEQIDNNNRAKIRPWTKIFGLITQTPRGC